MRGLLPTEGGTLQSGGHAFAAKDGRPAAGARGLGPPAPAAASRQGCVNCTRRCCCGGRRRHSSAFFTPSSSFFSSLRVVAAGRAAGGGGAIAGSSREPGEPASQMHTAAEARAPAGRRPGPGSVRGGPRPARPHPFWCRSCRMSEPPTNSPLMKTWRAGGGAGRARRSSARQAAVLPAEHASARGHRRSPPPNPQPPTPNPHQTRLRDGGPGGVALDALAQLGVGQHIAGAVVHACAVE